MSVMTKYARIVGTLAAAAAMTGCGTTGTGSTPAAGAGTAHSNSRPRAILMVTVLARAGATPTRWVLRCDPPGGTLAHPASACAELVRIRPFASRPARMACPMIIVGSGRITVTGTWYGQSVHRILVDGGCDFGQYGAFRKIFR